MTQNTQAIDLEPLHWITNYYPEDLEFCRECAEKKIEELKQERPDGEYILDGGWPTECDAPPQCEVCGKDLDYIPTDYCLAQYPESERMI